MDSKPGVSSGSDPRLDSGSGSGDPDTEEDKKPKFSKEIRRLSVGAQLNHFEAMALVRKAMVTGVTGSRPGSARARQQLSAEVEEAEELSEEELSEEEEMEVESGPQQLSREKS